MTADDMVLIFRRGLEAGMSPAEAGQFVADTVEHVDDDRPPLSDLTIEAPADGT